MADAEAPLTILYFAWLRERTGTSLESVTPPAGVRTVGELIARLAERSGIDPRELARRGLAWRHGGPAALDVLGASWEPAADAGGDAPGLLKAARAALRAATGTVVSICDNQVTAGGMQLRLGRDLLWYPYALSDGQWEPAGPPQADPARAAEAL